jgi:hypothetical protein
MIKLIDLLTESAGDDYINQLARSMGETIKSRLGSGVNGTAYETTSGNVLKLTGDAGEVALATRLRTKRLYKHIINVMAVRPVQNSDDYVILMNKVTPFNYEEQRLWNYVSSEYFNRSFTDKQFLAWIDRQPELTGSYKMDLDFINKITQQRRGVLRDFSELRIDSDEAHAGNMGWNQQDNLVHFDAWQQEHYTKVPGGTVNSWNMNRKPYQRGLGKTIPYTNPNIDNSVTGDIY